MQMLREQLDPSVEFREEVQARHVNLGVISKHVAFKGIGLNEVFEGGSIEKRGGPIAEFWDISTCQRQGITDDQQSGGGGGRVTTGWCPGSQVKKEYPGEGNDQLYGGLLSIDLWI